MFNQPVEECGQLGSRFRRNCTGVDRPTQLCDVDDDIPDTDHDFSVDVIVTPDEVIYCEPRRRPQGIVWEHLSEEKIRAIPVLASRADARR
ncbi:hypothetical protein [Amycolatopsis silviterrae]|uniref:Uncharacterized protein n=1 Tax=Amycolatopsis silviterrae TaxID=1656914 RepID=A0ABW5H0D2_9PSEU